jgi:hypothetical protein
VRQKLAHRYSVLPLLREFGPVRGYAFFVVQPAARVRDGERHRSQAFRGRVDDHHRVLFPSFACFLVPNTAPEINDLLTAVIGTTGPAQFVPPYKIPGKRFPDHFKSSADLPLNAEILRRCHTETPSVAQLALRHRR